MAINCACYLAKILKENEYFTHINLSKNEIRNKGAAFLAETLKVNDTIIHLDLSSNDIDDEGSKAIFDSLLYLV
jgi:Ran GTPase-activating protein (RanGAP) involved in mRNA processing and transport